MSDDSLINIAANTPEKDLNSSILKKVRSRVSSILPNSLQKWFSPSGKNGNLRKRRDSDSEDEIIDSPTTNLDNVRTQNYSNQQEVRAPPTKKTKTALNHDQFDEAHASTSSNYHSTTSTMTRKFTSTPTSATANRRKLLGVTNNTSPYNFSSHTSMLGNNINKTVKSVETYENEQNIGEDTTDEELEEEVQFVENAKPLRNADIELPFEFSDRKRLNIAPTFSGTNRYGSSHTKQNLISRNSHLTCQRERYATNTLIDEEPTEDDSENDVVLNGNTNESASDSGESSNKLSCSRPSMQYGKRPQSSSGRINTSLIHDGDIAPQPRLSGLFGTGSKRLRTGNSSGLNFSAHLQTHKSLFSDRNMPNSLNNSTTSLTSLNRRQSFNASLYGSTSSLNESRLLNTNSPFYNGRTMYGGASAYSRRPNTTQRTLRIPTQIRPASSLSTLCSSNNSLASPDVATSALSNTAKRILDLINQSTTPLADVKKMINSNPVHVPCLVAHRKRFDESDIALNRSIRMSSPKTPYSRPTTSRKVSPITNELQVPSMSQLLQMKKKLQDNTEKVRELATASKSILNVEEEYKLPDNNIRENDTKRISKIRNKITNNRNSKKSNKEEPIGNVNLPNIQFPLMKSIPEIDITVSKTDDSLEFPARKSSKSHISNNGISEIENITSKEQNIINPSSVYTFSTPIEMKIPSFAKNIDPISNFKFAEPLNVSVNLSKISTNTFSNFLFISSPIEIKNKQDISKTTSLLKNSSVLDALKTSENKELTSPVVPSLSNLFKGKDTDKWECSVCMIKNDIIKEKCIACETPNNQTNKKGVEQIPKIQITNLFGNQFKPSTDSWECSVCSIRNNTDLTKCVACETAKPGNKVIASADISKLFTIADQGFKNIVTEQSAKWECSTCMTRNEALRNKCECCEQAKPGSSVESSKSFSFGSSAPKYSFGVPFKDKQTSLTTKNTTTTEGEVNNQFTFGLRKTTSSTEKTAFTFGAAVGNLEKVVKPVPEFSFGTVASTAASSVASSVTSTVNEPIKQDLKTKDTTDTNTTGLKFGSSVAPTEIKSTVLEQSKPISFSSLTKSQNDKPIGGFSFGTSTENKKVDDVKNVSAVNTSVIFTFGSQQPLSVKSISPVKPSIETSKANFNFGGDSSLSSGISKDISTVSTPFNIGSTETAKVETLPTPVINSSLAIKPISTFGTAPGVDRKGGFSFPTNTTETKPAAIPVFGSAIPLQTTSIGVPTPTLTFGANIATTSAVTPQSTFIFGSPASNVTPITTISPFGGNTTNPAPSVDKSIGFFSPASTTSPFGALPNTSGFSEANTATENKTLPAVSASSFMFRSPVSNTTAHGFAQTAAAPTFGSTLPSFGSFGTPTVAPSPAFGATPSAFSSSTMNTTITAPAFGSTFGSSTTSSPIFGNTTNNVPTFGSSATVNNVFGVPSSSSGFSTLKHTAPSITEEPLSKKHAIGFNTVSSSNAAAPPPYSFTNNNNAAEVKAPFSFSASATPSFNFTSGQQPTSLQPYTFGSNVAPSSGVFNFGVGATEASSNTPFPFAAETNNPFSPQPNTANALQQRRKIRAVRRTQR